MRVTSELWASAVLRRVFSAGGYGAVVRRGSTEAGAIFILLRSRLGEVTLLGPAAQAEYGAGQPQDRLFRVVAEAEEPDAVEARIERERRFDPDLWVIELEADPATLADLVPVTRP